MPIIILIKPKPSNISKSFFRKSKYGPFLASKPNVVIIMLESFTSSLIEPLGGLPGVTPRFNEFVKEGFSLIIFIAVVIAPTKELLLSSMAILRSLLLPLSKNQRKEDPI